MLKFSNIISKFSLPGLAIDPKTPDLATMPPALETLTRLAKTNETLKTYVTKHIWFQSQVASNKNYIELTLDDNNETVKYIDSY